MTAKDSSAIPAKNVEGMLGKEVVTIDGTIDTKIIGKKPLVVSPKDLLLIGSSTLACTSIVKVEAAQRASEKKHQGNQNNHNNKPGKRRGHSSSSIFEWRWSWSISMTVAFLLFVSGEGEEIPEGFSKLCAVKSPTDCHGEWIYLEEQRGAADNPFDHIHNFPNPKGWGGLGKPNPQFVDIDGDGDQDLFIGEGNGQHLQYYENTDNTGTKTNPVYTRRTGAANPFDSLPYTDEWMDLYPFFIDIDNDGDIDLFLGNRGPVKELSQPWGTPENPWPLSIWGIPFWKNTGTKTNPLFVKQASEDFVDIYPWVRFGLFSDTENDPNIFVGGTTALTSADLDSDGVDEIYIFTPTTNNQVHCYKNTGTSSSPIYTKQNGAANPLYGMDCGNWPKPMFFDIGK